MVFIAPPGHRSAPAGAAVRRRRLGLEPAPHGWAPYTVRAGDTLEGIATRHRTTVGVLVTRNHIRDRHHIMAGTRLRCPAPRPRPRPPGARVERRPRGAQPARPCRASPLRYRVPLASLLKANHLQGQRLHPPRARRSPCAGRRRRRAPPRRSAAKGAALHRAQRRHPRRHRHPAPHHRRRDRQGQRHLDALGHPPGPAAHACPAARGKASRSSVPDTFNGVKYPRAIAEAAARNRAILARRDGPEPQRDQGDDRAGPRAGTGSTRGSRSPSPTRSRGGTSAPSRSPTPSA